MPKGLSSVNRSSLCSTLRHTSTWIGIFGVSSRRTLSILPCLGALELGQRVLNNLREKDTTISNQEYEIALIALLLHDVGHGPLSHTLEHSS